MTDVEVVDAEHAKIGGSPKLRPDTHGAARGLRSLCARGRIPSFLPLKRGERFISASFKYRCEQAPSISDRRRHIGRFEFENLVAAQTAWHRQPVAEPRAGL